MMTREDVLRELELLPVWQLRAPLKPLVVVDNPVLHDEPVVEVTSVVEPVLEKSAYEKPLSFAPELIAEPILEPIFEAIQEPLTEGVAAEPISYQCIASDDNAYLFILSVETLSANAQTLINNIWRAMRVNTQPILNSNPASLDLMPYQVVITMGEAVAQQLLARTETLQALRSQTLNYAGKTLIATFDAAHLLQNSADKPQAWADLISAMQVVHDLKNTKTASSKI